MKIKFTFLLVFSFLLICNFSFSKQNEIFKSLKVVKAKSGLRMRSGPGVNFSKLDTIPNNSIIKILKYENNIVNIGSNNGKWTQIIWKNKKGWVFSYFLKDTPSWIQNLNYFWMWGKETKGSIAYDFTNIFSNGRGASMGCPGGISEFRIKTIKVIDANKILLNYQTIPAYEDEVTQKFSILIEYFSDQEIEIKYYNKKHGLRYKRSEKKNCFD